MKKVQVITGGGSGMGLASAKVLAHRGPVLIGGRTESKLEKALKELKELGIEAYAKVCDTESLDSTKAFAEEAQKIGEIDVILHAAGISMAMADADKILKVNALGTVNMVDTFYPLISEGITMVNVSSIGGYWLPMNESLIKLFEDPYSKDFIDNCVKYAESLPYPTLAQSAYIVSKRFTTNYSERNVLRFAKKGARILSISPGVFETPMVESDINNGTIQETLHSTPVEHIGDPMEIGVLVDHICDSRLSFLTGCDILIDGGNFAANSNKQFV